MRKAFVEGGRPAGQVFKTFVVNRLDQWAAKIAVGQTPLRAVLLVGGPGNGKTDAVEQFVEILGTSLGNGARLLDRCRALNVADLAGCVPRKLAVPIADLFPSSTARPPRELWIVQDASVGNGSNGGGPEACLVDELRSALDLEDILYLCCVNRGVLADALTHIREHREDGMPTPVEELLQATAVAVAQGSEPQPCWPLERFPNVAVWPMDAESLLEGKSSPAQQIFASALDERFWPSCGACPAANICPFKANRDALSNGSRLEHLLTILRRYELVSGKRWTFRDVYSLVAELIVGHESDFRTRAETLTPCEWVRRQAVAVDNWEHKDPKKRRRAYEACLQMAMRLYQQALFPEWPALHGLRDALRKAQGASADREATRAVLDEFDHRRAEEETQVRRLLRSSLTPLLDPGLATQETQLTEKRSVRDLDLAFSRSVREGIDRARATQDFCELDRRLLDLLERGESSLGTDHVLQSRLSDARRIQLVLRQVAARFAKRCILVRRGFTRDHELLIQYEDTARDDAALRRLGRSFNDLLNRESAFRASLLRCVGQPRRSPRRDVVLVSAKVNASVRSIGSLAGEGRAPTTTPFLVLVVGRAHHAVALTFSLFKALARLEAQCHPACLPPDVLAVIQGLESRLAGQRVRDPAVLEDQYVYMELLGGNLFVQVEPDGGFIVSRTRPA